MRTTTCLQYLQTSDSDEPARNSIDEPQFGQGPVATAMIEGEHRSFSLRTRGGSLRDVTMIVGTEWLVDALGCRAEALRDLAAVRCLLEKVLVRLELRVIGEGAWHKFEGEGGVTGLYLLTESHLSVHTYPEHGAATFNLYCCRPRPDFPWERELGEALGAAKVTVRVLERGRAGT